MSQSDPRYPLAEHGAGTLRAASGRPLAQITADALAAGELTGDDLRISAEALCAQAAIAQAAGFGQVAANLRRAAELTALPNAELLRAYEALRPGRSSYEELLALAARLAETYGAAETASFVREAAQAYQARGLTRRSD